MITKLLTTYSLLFSSILAIQAGAEYEKFEFENKYKFESEILEKVEADTVPWKYQLSAGEFASKGDYKNALDQWQKGFPMRSRQFAQDELDSIYTNYKLVSAKNYILEAAKNTRIVIINEAHHNSSHRFYTSSLLADLYKQGYNHLGLEALFNDNNKDKRLIDRGYPTYESGYYTKDPQFGNMIRNGISLGINIFPYEENKGVNEKDREIEQAFNIVKYIEAHPNDKYIIHVGFDHVLEGKHRSWEKAMAQRLKEITGIDPLTINQVVYSETSTREFNNPFLKAFDVKEASLLVDSKNTPVKYWKGEGYTDIAILHPNSNYELGRPSWLWNNGFHPYPFSLDEIDLDFPVIVLAFMPNDDIEKAIPVDIIEINNEDKKGILALKNGDYKMVIVNQNNEARVTEIKVD